MRYVKKLIVPVLSLHLGLFILVAACKAENAAGSPAEPVRRSIDNSVFLGYVPQGWILQDDRIVGRDINRDGVKDAILTVVEDKKLNKGDLRDIDDERALVILLGDKSGKFHRLSFAKNALLCASCAGLMRSSDDSEPGEIRYDSAGTLTVGWISGSRDTVNVELNFRFDPNLKQFVLMSETVEKRQRIAGISTITKRDFKAGTKTVDGKVLRMKKTTTPLEAVKFYNYLEYDFSEPPAG